jgi:hypothetical protein
MPQIRSSIARGLSSLATSKLGSLELTDPVWMAVEEPSIPLYDYAKRLQNYMHCSPACIITSIIYIDYLMQLKSSICIHPLTMHRLLLAAMVVQYRASLLIMQYLSPTPFVLLILFN